MTKWLGFASLAVVGAIAVYWSIYPSVTIRYRVTLEVDVNGQLKTGSSVNQVTYSKQSQFAATPPLSIGFKGEATVLDLGSRGMLFAILTAERNEPKPEWIVPFAFGLFGKLTSPVEEGIRRLRLLEGSRELPLDNLPLLVRFRDLNDPKSVERVDPYDISKSFGSGAILKRVVVEIVPIGMWPFNLLGITGVPLTSVVETVLPWLPKYYAIMFNGSPTRRLAPGAPLSSSLGFLDFKIRG